MKGSGQASERKASPILDDLITSLPSIRDHHTPGTGLYNLLKRVARREVESLFSDKEIRSREMKPFGELIFPFHKMGVVDSLNLFDLDELILFSFYWTNRKRYKHVLDIGANIGLHSIILNRCGFEVTAYEPDPQHFQVLERNLNLNGCSDVRTVNSAVSSRSGTMEFIRILGNTTGSHLAGSKPNPYGDLERFPVRVEAIETVISGADLIKLDAEGHEKEILIAMNRDHWLKTDALVEVGSEPNAIAIFNHFKRLGINLFSQKTNWDLVCDVRHMPASYHDGTLFISSKTDVPWSEAETPSNGAFTQRRRRS
jgi:FkbM family methyltransferase